ncbi:hypothetical protein, partial [Roseibium hamelinense]
DITNEMKNIYNNNIKKLFNDSMKESNNIITHYDKKCMCWLIISDVNINYFSLLCFYYASETARFVFEFNDVSIVLKAALISRVTL